MHSLHTNCITEGALLYVYGLFMEIQEISRGGELSDVWQRTVEHNGLFCFLSGTLSSLFFLSSMHLLPTQMNVNNYQ